MRTISFFILCKFVLKIFEMIIQGNIVDIPNHTIFKGEILIEKGKIVDVIEKGYKLGDKIIRFPKVVIGN